MPPHPSAHLRPRYPILGRLSTRQATPETICRAMPPRGRRVSARDARRKEAGRTPRRPGRTSSPTPRTPLGPSAALQTLKTPCRRAFIGCTMPPCSRKSECLPRVPTGRGQVARRTTSAPSPHTRHSLPHRTPPSGPTDVRALTCSAGCTTPLRSRRWSVRPGGGRREPPLRGGRLCVKQPCAPPPQSPRHS